MNTKVQGWILYDDSCGFCRRWVPFWKQTLQKFGFDIAPLLSEFARSRLTLSESELLADLRLLFPDGKQIRGADVYRYVMRRIWWAGPIYIFSITPICRQIFDWSYRTFATNRFRFSSACRLKNPIRS